MEKIKIEIDSLFGDIEAVGDSNRSSKSLPKMGFKGGGEMRMRGREDKYKRSMFYFEEEK